MFQDVRGWRKAIYIMLPKYKISIWCYEDQIVEIDKDELIVKWVPDYDVNYPILRNRVELEDRTIVRYMDVSEIYESDRLLLNLNDPHFLRKALKFITNI